MGNRTNMEKINKIIIGKTKEALAEEGARLFAEIVKRVAATGQECMIALSGGSTPRKMHALLGQDPYGSRIPWNRVHLFWGDERCVPADSRWSNYGGVREDLLDFIDIPAENIHPMPCQLPPEEGAVRYEKEIPDVFDLVFLGLGADGHTASLFPGHGALGEQKRRVVPLTGGEPDVPRLTMTFPVINKARNVVFVVSEREKAEVVKHVLEDRDTRFPAAHVFPVAGSLIWIVDREAVSRLSKEVISAFQTQ